MMSAHPMVARCFSAWIGRPNPEPNIGLVSDDDVADFIRDVAQKCGLGQPECRYGALLSLNDLTQAIQHAAPDAARKDIWVAVTKVADTYSHLSAEQITPDLQLLARLKD